MKLEIQVFAGQQSADAEGVGECPLPSVCLSVRELPADLSARDKRDFPGFPHHAHPPPPRRRERGSSPPAGGSGFPSPEGEPSSSAGTAASPAGPSNTRWHQMTTFSRVVPPFFFLFGEKKLVKSSHRNVRCNESVKKNPPQTQPNSLSVNLGPGPQEQYPKSNTST